MAFYINYIGGKNMAVYATCPRCGTTVRLGNSSTGPSGNYWYGTCPCCKNKVIKEK